MTEFEGDQAMGVQPRFQVPPSSRGSPRGPRRASLP
jgi:hypothetical protein